MTMFNFSKAAFAALILLGGVATVSAAPVSQDRTQRQVVVPSASADEQPFDTAKGNIW
jgi:hypothetical protein